MSPEQINPTLPIFVICNRSGQRMRACFTQESASRRLQKAIDARPDLAPYSIHQFYPASHLAAQQGDGALVDDKRDAERYRWLRSCMWWRTDPFAQDTGNMRTGYWQTKLFKRAEGATFEDVIDAAIAAEDAEKP